MTDSAGDSASFTTKVLPGDAVRLVTSAGAEHFAAVDQVTSDSVLLLGAPLPPNESMAFYQIVKRYVPDELSSVRVDLAPYAAEYYDRDAVEAMFNRMRPTHVGYTYVDSAIEVINVANNPAEEYDSITELEEESVDDGDLIIQAREPVFIETMADGADRVDVDFIVGPAQYQWMIEEAFSAVLEYDRTEN